MVATKPTREASGQSVLEVLQRSTRGRVWSSIAAELYDIPREEVTMQEVRGVRDACRRLQGAGLISESPRLVFFAA